MQTTIPKRASKPPDALPFLQADVQQAEATATEDHLPPKRLLWGHGREMVSGMLLTLVLMWLGTQVLLPFATQTTEHWNCGQDRICHYDLAVGHNGTSHFIAEYWNNQVLMIEFVGGDPGNSHAYCRHISVIGDSSPRIVTLKTASINPQGKQGKPDILAQVSGFAVPVVFYNTGTGFSMEVPDEVK